MRVSYLRGLVMVGVGVLLLMSIAFRAPSSSGVTLAEALDPTPTRPAPPPLPTQPTPTVSPTPPVVTEGALIWLQVQCDALCPPVNFPWQNLWTVVQWQDAQGDWHDVEGWRGTLEEVVVGEGSKVWWLPADLFGVGPFRWQVYAHPGGALLATSTAFYLPDSTGRIDIVTVTFEF